MGEGYLGVVCVPFVRDEINRGREQRREGWEARGSGIDFQQLFVRKFWHVLRRDRLGVKRERVWWFGRLGINFDMAREGASEI